MTPEQNEAKQALKELWGLIKEYDLEIEIEESAQEIDSRSDPDEFGFRNHEWARVLGIMEGVKVALGISQIQAEWEAHLAEQGKS